MILRLFYGAPRPGGEQALVDAMAVHARPTLERLPALTGFQAGVWRGDAPEVAIATVWTGLDAIFASGAAVLDAAREIGGAPGYFLASHADHYELVLGDGARLPVPGARLRVTALLLRAQAEAGYFEAVREAAGRLLAEYGLEAYVLGRRVVGDRTEVCAVSVWRGGAARPFESGDQPVLATTEALTRFYAAPPVARTYEPVDRDPVVAGAAG